MKRENKQTNVFKWSNKNWKFTELISRVVILNPFNSVIQMMRKYTEEEK